MAIKIQGSTIIDDSRKVLNASQVGIGTINPSVELDVDGDVNISGVSTFSDDLTIGSNTVETDINILGSTITYTDVVGGYGNEPTKFYSSNLTGVKNFVISVNHNTSSQHGGLLIRNATDTVAEFSHNPNTYDDFHPTPHCFEVYGGSIQIRNDREGADYLQAPPTLSLWNRVEGSSFTSGDEIHRIDFVAQDASGPGSGTIIRIADVINDTTGADHSLKFFTSDTPNGSPLTTSLSLGPKATELYYLGSKKFETTGYGVTVSGSAYISGIATITTIDATNATIDNLTFTSGTAITSVDTDLASVSGSDDTLASAKAIKTYVDSQVTAQDLDFAGDTGTGAVDLDTETLIIQGTTNEIETVGSGNTITIGLPNVVAITTSLTVGDATPSGGAPTDEGVLAVYGTGRNALIIQTDDNTLSRGLAFRNNGDKYGAYISAEDAGNNKVDLAFGVAASSSGIYTDISIVNERVRITSDGNVGLGTSAPSANLDVDGTLNVSGVSTFQSHVHLGDNDELRFGDDSDFEIYHAGTFSVIKDTSGTLVYRSGSHRIKNQGSTEDLAVFNANGAVELYYDNSKKFETTGAGVTVFGTTQTQQLNVSGVSTFQGNVNLGDNDVLNIGDSNDLQIYHTGSLSYISDQGTGSLRVLSNTVRIRHAADNGNMAVFNDSGSVELYYDNSKKFETTGIGVSIVNGTSDTATIAGPSNLIIDPAVVGDNTGIVRIKGDLFVDGTTTQINSTSLEIADFVVGIATTATTDLLSDGAGIGIGSDKTFLYEHNSGTNPSLKSSENLNIASGKVYQINQIERLSNDTLTLGTGTSIRAVATNKLTFETNGEERVRINASGNVGIGTNAPSSKLDIRGNVHLGDDDELRFGASNDFKIVHDPNDCRFENSNGDIKFKNTGSYFFFDEDGGETLASFINDGAVNLYHAGSKKFETTSTGIDVTGHIETDTLNVSGITTLNSLQVTSFSTFDGNTKHFDGKIANFGNDSDLQIVHDGNNAVIQNATGQFFIDNNASGGDLFLRANDDVVIRVDGNNTVLTAQTGGIDVTGHTETDTLNVSGVSTFESTVGIGTRIDLIPYDTIDNGTLSFEGSAGQLFSITNNLTSGSIFSVNDVSGIPSIDVNADGTIQLAPYGSTENVGIGTTNPTAKLDIRGNVHLSDNDELRFGDGNDLKIYHDGSNSYIDENGTGDLRIRTASNGQVRIARLNNVALANFNGSGSVELYYDGDKKFETTGYGVSVFGGINVSGLSTFIGDVGIGTDNPGAKLEVAGTGSPTFRISDLDGTNQFGQILANNGTFVIESRNDASDGQIIFRGRDSTDTNEYARFDGSGRLGIGTNNPGSTLAVGGTITELYNGTYWNVVTQADVGYGASQVPLNQYLGQLAFLDDFHPNGLRRDGGGSDDVVVSSGGNVGINSTSPTVTLDVLGDANISGVITATSFHGDGSKLTTNYAKFIGIGTADLNTSTSYTEVSWLNTTPQFSNGTWSATSSHIVVPSTGLYMVQVNMYVTATIQRGNVGLKFAVNDVVQSEIAAHDYIRFGSGHNESSINMSTTLFLNANDEVSVYTARLAVVGVMELQGTNSTIALTQLA